MGWLTLGKLNFPSTTCSSSAPAPPAWPAPSRPSARVHRPAGRQGLSLQLPLPLSRAHDLLHHAGAARDRRHSLLHPQPEALPRRGARVLPQGRRATTPSTSATTRRSSASPVTTTSSPSTPPTASTAHSPTARASSSSPPATTTCPTTSTSPAKSSPRCKHYYDDPHPFFGLDVVVIGGKNSAAITALDLWRHGARVTLVHRGAEMHHHVKYWILPDINNRIANGEIAAHFSSTVASIAEDTVTIATPRGEVIHSQPLRLRPDRLPPRLQLPGAARHPLRRGQRPLLPSATPRRSSPTSPASTSPASSSPAAAPTRSSSRTAASTASSSQKTSSSGSPIPADDDPLR